jgi:hypothetical protein
MVKNLFLLLSSEVPYRIHNNPPLAPILCQVNSLDTSCSLYLILSNILRIDLRRGPLFITIRIMYAFVDFLMHATNPAYHKIYRYAYDLSP